MALPPAFSDELDSIVHANDTLWDRSDLFRKREAKSALGLQAIAGALRQHRPLDGAEDEFLELHSWLTRLDSSAFTGVWTDPRSYRWTWIAYTLLKACLTRAAADGLEAQARLAEHLADFKLFALGAAYLTNQPLRLRQPYLLNHPITFGGTDWAVVGRRPIAILGIEAGQLFVVPGTAEPQLEQSPTVRFGSCQLRLDPHIFNGQDLEDIAKPLSLGFDFQRSGQATVHAALEAMAKYDPATFRHFSDIRVVALKRLGQGGYVNTSHSTLPGAFAASLVQHPLVMADVFIHEYYHHRLFCIEDLEPILEATSALESVHYSPWRSDPRPLKGVLHGVYVYAAVCRYWLAVLADTAAPSVDRIYATERVLRIYRQLRAGERVVGRQTRLTTFGRALFAALQARIAALEDVIRGMDLPQDVIALQIGETGVYTPERSAVHGREHSVADAVREHRELHDTERES